MKDRSVMGLVGALWFPAGIVLWIGNFTGQPAWAWIVGLALFMLGALVAFGRIKDWW